MKFLPMNPSSCMITTYSFACYFYKKQRATKTPFPPGPNLGKVVSNGSQIAWMVKVLKFLAFNTRLDHFSFTNCNGVCIFLFFPSFHITTVSIKKIILANIEN